MNILHLVTLAVKANVSCEETISSVLDAYQCHTTLITMDLTHML